MRRLPRLAAIVGILAMLFAACGPAATPTPTAPPQPTATPSGPSPTVARPTATPVATPTKAPDLPSPTPGVQRGGKLLVQGLEPISFEPHGPRGGGQAGRHIFETLTELDAGGKVGPGLAESWQVVSPTEIVLKLHKGVKFHDGSPFNAQVVKWNIGYIFDPNTIAPESRPNLASVDTVEVIDDYTVKFKLKTPSAILLSNLGQYSLSMMTPTAVTKWGKDVGLHPVGTGPFVFQEWLPASRVKVTRNPAYWGSPLPYLDDIEWRTMEEYTVILASVLSGGVDLAEIFPITHVERLEKTPGVKVYTSPGEKAWGLFVNHLNPPLNDLNFRKAIDLAIDRDGLVNAVLRGRGQPANTIMSSLFPEKNLNLPIVKRDVAQARELVAKSGYKGQVLDFAGSPSYNPEMAEAYQANLKEVGINIQISQYPGASYGLALGNLKYDLGMLQSAHFPLDLKIDLYYHSAARLNRGRYGNTPAARKADELVEKIRVAYDWNTRKALYDELQKLAFDEVLDIYVFYQPKYMVARDTVQNYNLYLGQSRESLTAVWLKR